MIETEKIVPQIDSRKSDLLQINDAVRLVHDGLKNQTAVLISVDIYPDGVYNINTLWGYLQRRNHDA